MDTTSIVLKRDGLGRVCTPVERREALVAEFQCSGLSAARFAQLAGVRYNTFWTWLKKHGAGVKPSGRKDGVKQGFVEVVVKHPMAAAHEAITPLRVTLPGGATLSLVTHQQVPMAVQLIQALATPC